MTLDEARRAFESRFTVWPEIGNYALAPTGEPYVAVCSGGIKPEAELTPAVGLTEESALKLLIAAWNEYADGKSGTLYWRILPEIGSLAYFGEGVFAADAVGRTDQERKDFYRHVFWKAYSRLLISNKPVIQQARIEPNLARRQSIQEFGYLKVGAIQE